MASWKAVTGDTGSLGSKVLLFPQHSADKQGKPHSPGAGVVLQWEVENFKSKMEEKIDTLPPSALASASLANM